MGLCDDPVGVAHAAEVECSSGLGDVVAQAEGGLVVRERPGAPPHGRTVSLDAGSQLVLCVVGKPLETGPIITDPEWTRKINRAGTRALGRFNSERTLERFVELAWAFSRETGLATPGVVRAVEALGSHGAGFMAMLGRTVVACGDVEEIVPVLRKLGDCRVTAVSPEGARLL
jgi:pantoate kinase